MAVQMIDVRAHRKLIGEDIDARIATVVEHGQWIMGPEVREFETALDGWVGGGVHSIGCSNGTDAIVLALQALELKPGQAVVCPSFTFIATAEAVAFLGGRPVFADVDPHTFNVTGSNIRDAAKAAEAEGLEVVGVIAVDLFGQAADYSDINAVAKELGAWVIADSAQSFGGSSPLGMIGSLADVTTTSFFPAKPLGCYGDGGAVFTSNDELAARMRSLQVHGKGSDKYDNVLIGQNSRLDTLQAAILIPKLGILADEIAGRQRVADEYRSLLSGSIETPRVLDGYQSAWAQYTVKVPNRAEIQARLATAGIGTAVYYPKPLHLQTAYRHFHLDTIELPVSEQLAEQVLSLPMHPYLTSDQVVESAQPLLSL